MNRQHDRSSNGDVIAGGAGSLAALGILTMALFPFAVPGLVLAAAAILPLAALGLVVGVLAALAAGPTVALRGLRRRRGRKLNPDREVLQ